MARNKVDDAIALHTKVGSRDRGLVAERGSFESLTDVNHALYEVEYGASLWSLTEQSTQLHIQMSHE